MNKINLYHCCRLENLNSIYTYGLIPCPFYQKSHFSDDENSSIKFIKWREELRTNEPITKLGLVIFETTIENPSLEINHGPYYPELNFLDLKGNNYSYNDVITRNRLKFLTVEFKEGMYNLSEFKLNTKEYKVNSRVLKNVRTQSNENFIFYDLDFKCFMFLNQMNILPGKL